MKKISLLSISFSLAFLFAVAFLTPVSAQKTIEDQYWDLVKDSKKVAEVQSYLKTYPKGKYVALAKLKVRQLSGSTPTASSFLSFKVTTAMTDEAFLERWENDLRNKLPIRIGEYEIYRAAGPTSLESYFYTSVRTPSLSSPTETKRKARILNGLLLSDYCKSEAFQRRITVVLGFKYDNGNGYANHLSPAKCSANTNQGSKQNQKKVPISMELSLQSGIQEGANGRNRIPINRNDPAYTVRKLLWNPAIYVDVKFSDGTKIGPHDYKKTFANNLIFDDVSGDPNDLIEVSWWDIDSNNPGRGKYAAQLASTGKGSGTAYLKVSLRDTPNVKASVKVEIVSGAAAGKQTDIQFLNTWSAEVRVDLPELVGGYKLVDAKSWCPSGCDYSGPSGSANPHLRLIFDANPNHRRIPTKEIERTLKPVLLQVYCQTESIQRNLNMNVVFQNRDVTPYNFWVYPRECS